MYKITGTPCKHFPVGEGTGFVLETNSFGLDPPGKPNAIYFSGDSVFINELREIGKRWHLPASIFNLGNATFEFPTGPIQITMDRVLEDSPRNCHIIKRLSLSIK